MFTKMKQWDNRKEVKQNKLKTINGRTWTRRIQWFEDNDTVKLKFDDGELYIEFFIMSGLAQVVWDRFKTGMSIQDSLSIFGVSVPKSLASKKGG